MDFNQLKKSVCVLSLLIVSPVWAISNSSQNHFHRNKPKVESEGPLAIALSIQNGYTSLQSGDVSGSGGMTELSLNASYSLPEWTIDLGAGYMSSDLNGNTASTSSGLSEFQMTTQAFVAQFSPQYRLTDAIQIGPLAQILMGEDVGFRPGIGFTGQTSAWLGGAQALYGFKLGSVRLKAGLNYLKSLNIPDKNLQAIQAAIQIGLPIL